MEETLNELNKKNTEAKARLSIKAERFVLLCTLANITEFVRELIIVSKRIRSTTGSVAAMYTI
jgi:hypothetical protein